MTDPAGGLALVVPLHELRCAIAALRDELIHHCRHGTTDVNRAITTLTTHAVAAGPRFTDRVLALVDATTPTPHPEQVRHALDDLAFILHVDPDPGSEPTPLGDLDGQLRFF